MAQVHIENQLSTQDQVKAGHIIVVNWSKEVDDLQKNVTHNLKEMDVSFFVAGESFSPQNIVSAAAEQSAHAVICLLNNGIDRRHIYRLMMVCRRQRFDIPILMIGEFADPQYAQILALPDHGDLYQGGVYYCEDAEEMKQVLKHIILYTPPPSSHEHSHDEADAFSCSDCGGCADACGFNQNF